MPRFLNIAYSLLALCLSFGCTQEPIDTPLFPSGHRAPASATSAPGHLSDAELKNSLIQFKSRGSHEFYMGDHLMMNLKLTLLAGNGYSLTWHGCQGLYGASVGKWTVSEGRVILEPYDEQGSLAETSIRVLHVRQVPSYSFPDFALIPQEHLAAFEKEGVQHHTCFRDADRVLSEWLHPPERK
jgi:hypothetical protein